MSSSSVPPELLSKAERTAARLPYPLPADGLRVLALSDFAANVMAREAQWIQDALEADRFSAPLASGEVRATLAAVSQGAEDLGALQQSLRQWRNRYQLWVVWRHLLRMAPLEETCATLSMLADTMLDLALERLYQWATDRQGVPMGESSRSPQRLVVLALGKLGARELNLSSDIDLVFAYPEPGATTSGTTNQQFFLRLGQQLIQALDAVTADGFAFRVDMRLRPFGASGPLVMHFEGMEDYFAAHGRDWERYAWIKARACAGDVASGEALLQSLRPFVYRRYLDFGAVDALRDMKRRLYSERNDPNDVKLGPGGIRDVEFVVQLQQMVWGGRQPELQEANLLRVLPRLASQGHLSDADAAALAEGYRFLRDTEHSIQAEGDLQTQSLPASEDSRQRLASSRGFADYGAFESALNGHRIAVEAVFRNAVGELPEEDTPGQRLWSSPDDAALLGELGFARAEAAGKLLTSLMEARDRPSQSAESRARLDRLMPGLLDRVSLTEDPDLSLARVVPVLRSVLRRSAYLSLLRENPHTLAHFVDLTAKSLWLAEQLARFPAFFDALLDERQLAALPDKAALQAELHQQVEAAPADDFERRLDVLREFKEHHVFNVSLAEVRGTLPLMKASDYLTFLAEAVLGESLDLAWNENADRFPEFAEPRPFIIVGYGKLGGIELGPGSDLDLVFIHDLPVGASQFLHRMVRRLLHILTVPTYSGTLYEIDMRLRPSGSSGTMVSSLEAFAEYQRSQAWMWEHQALVRARAVAGDPALAQRFEAVRRELLCEPRDRGPLREEVLKMRARMAEHHGDAEDLKRGSGGIVDIEFMVQYLVLAWAHEHPALAEFSDNVRILETAERLDLLPANMARNLREAYVGLRSEWHRSVLDLPDSERAARTLMAHRSDVRDAWREVFGIDPENE
ncbi:MAG TPA: bifunctional [glutamate--ammonia ligase]-adenylyl-L-tyrosine phosphorylase/[glutamate--ammonia-ligase] adenylyltransferase [Pseudomonadales bacterium]